MAENGDKPSSYHTVVGSTLTGIKFKRVLLDCAEKKCIFIEAEVENSPDPAIIILDKLPFTEDTLQGIISGSTSLETVLQNDIYGQYRLLPDPQHNEVKANIIHPATQKHIDKYTTSPPHLVYETAELYHGVTLPFIEKEKFSVSWVYNFLDHKSETDRVIYENSDPINGFMMAPDFKWNGKQIEDLYCLAIVHRRDVKSLRDLSNIHLPMLYNLQNEGKKAISDKYGLPSSQIRAYVHYQPSYYHFHVHYTNLAFTPPGVNAEKSHMLETVISNLENNPGYYQEATLSFVVREKEKLFKTYQEFGYFKEGVETIEFMDIEFEKDDGRKVLNFLQMIGKAKHEPSGEMWETTYGESSWRMAILSMCLPSSVNRNKLVQLSLVSSLSSLGSCNDENTEWETKLQEVKTILREFLPPLVAGKLAALFTEHAEIRRGRLVSSIEHQLYRGIMELEEIILRWEEEKKSCPDLSKVSILKKMAELQFPGSTRFNEFKDPLLLEKSLNFILEISTLQKLKRTGWVNCQVREPETVASHMFRMGFMGVMFSHKESTPGADACIISIMHDMAECRIGDITPHCKVPAEEKKKKEMLAFTGLIENLPESTGMDLLIPFRRYENQTPGDLNAILTKDFDKFDMILQAFEYEKREKRGKFLQQFFDSTQTVFETRAVKKWQNTLLEMREEFFNQDL